MPAPAEVVLATAGQGASGVAAPAAVEEAGAAAEEAAAAPSAPSPGSSIGVSTPLSFTLILFHLDVLQHKVDASCQVCDAFLGWTAGRDTDARAVTAPRACCRAGKTDC